MRRLFSNFADGWPGAGLLLLRSVAGFTLITRAATILTAHPPMLTTVISVLLIIAALFLIAGLFTPVAGIFIAVIMFLGIVTFPTGRSAYLLLATMAAALAMVGPGFWSVDARLFGFKRIELPPR
jgi:putative oxidoreductase